MHSLEVPHQHASNEYLQLKFLWRIDKTILQKSTNTNLNLATWKKQWRQLTRIWYL